MVSGRKTLARIAVGALTSAAVMLGGAACSSGTATDTAGGLAGVAAATAAPTGGAALDAKGFAAAIKVPGTVVIDVRTPAEYADGHLAGARNLDVNAADFATKAAALPKGVPYALYCHSGNRSGTALAIMTRLGYTTAYHLAGGITAWTSAGGAVTKS